MAALNRAVRGCVGMATAQTDRLRDRLQRLHLDQRLRQKAQALTWTRQRLIRSVQQRLQQDMQHCDLLQQKLQTLDPQAVLQRGYAVVRQEDGAIVRAIAHITPTQTLTLQLAHGQVRVQVVEVLEPSRLDADALGRMT
jgi:exodeoxyribonuclease VII large subunit